MPGKLIHWFDIPVLDIERAAQFYRTVLDLKLTRVEAPPDVTMEWFASDEPHGGGGLIQGLGRKPSAEGTIVYFNAGDDLNTVLNCVEPAGGQIVMPKTGDDNSGYVAFFTDTEGNRVGLQSPH